jgi:rhamnosyltransferase
MQKRAVEGDDDSGAMTGTLKNTAVGRAILRIGKGSLSAWNALALILYLAGEARLRGHGTGAAPVAGLRTGMLAHVFYPDLMDEIIACRANLPGDAVCHITAPQDVAAALAGRIDGMPGFHLHVVENRGRDIAPFLAVLRSGALDGLDAVLKIHSKRSLHLSHGGLLRRAMFTALAGSPGTVSRILGLMADPTIGMVGWRRVFLTRLRHWHTNRSRVEELAGRLDPPVRPDLAFFGGSMFWFRPKALAAVAALPVAADDFEVEAGQIDGTLHHALERLFAIAAAGAGYRVTDTEGGVLLPAAGGLGHRPASL